MSFSRYARGLFTFFLFSGLTIAHAYAANVADSAIDAKQSQLLKKLKVTPQETALFVADLHCKTCAKKVAGKIYGVKGVKRVRTNVKEDVAIITPQKKKRLDVNALWKAAQAAGFPPVKLVGPAGTYVADPKTKAARRLPDPVPASKKS
ncbi:MAG: heavy-metal-associated domain-containing protein [Pirellulales bacterium]|nr:heavy-metal-associated domain-containing protein [Pirellulales bacterium]